MVKLPKYNNESWTDARAKAVLEGRCRVCNQNPIAFGDARIEAAHTIGRKDQDTERRDIVKEGGVRGYGSGSHRYVPPEAIIPLCAGLDSPSCHAMYDAHRLDILPYLTYEEQANAVAAVGIVRALQRLTSNKEVLA